MVAAIFKTSLMMATIAVTGSPGIVQNASPAYQSQASAQASNAALASALAQWRALQQTDALPFDSYAGFVMAHPGWPNELANRRAAERKAAGGDGSAGSIVAFFRHFPPLTSAGHVAQARALQGVGLRTEANEAARTAWRRGGLSGQDEAFVLTNFGSALAPADQDARMDALLWQGQTTTAARQLTLVSPVKQALFAARLAMRMRSGDAAQAADNSNPQFITDPGYIADKAMYLRNTGAELSARALLARPHNLASRPGDVGKWYAVLSLFARGAAADNQWQTAYDIARQVDDAYPAGTDVSSKSYAERDEYTNLTWLGGQAAMKHLGRPADAMTLFERYAGGSQGVSVTTRGLYWAGRAAEAAGKKAEAAAFYDRTTGFRDQFYGQLAAERTGKTLGPPPPISAIAVSPSERRAFDARETVRAAKFLGQIADRQDQTAFIRQIASDATTDSDHLLAAELSRTIGRPDLGVMVGRSALRNGLTDYSAAGFPTITVPPGFEPNWTIIHAISRQESQFDRTAVSHAGARGLMQLMPATAREQSGKIGLSYSTDALANDPTYSIRLGSSYFDRIFANYGSYPLAIAAYNAGGGNVNKWLRANGDPRTGAVDMVDWIEMIPFQETRNYVQRVLENAVVYDLMNPPRARSRSKTPLSWYLGKTARPG